MAVSAGTHLGSYEVIAQIGAGGMGEVYEARDTKLGRNVAIKVLPSAFVNDPVPTLHLPLFPLSFGRILDVILWTRLPNGAGEAWRIRHRGLRTHQQRRVGLAE
jgi:serine/threonine protein kinase